jgi:hypothetical protein
MGFSPRTAPPDKYLTPINSPPPIRQPWPNVARGNRLQGRRAGLPPPRVLPRSRTSDLTPEALHPAVSETAYSNDDANPGLALRLPGPVAPLDGVFRPFLGHFGAEADGFPGQKGRSPDAGDA